MSSNEVSITVKLTIEDTALKQAIDDSVNEAVGENVPTTEMGGAEEGGFKPQSMMGALSKNNPAGLLQMLAPILTGPAGIAMMAAAIGPVIADFIIKELVRDGGVLDLRFKRKMENETGVFYTRQLQYDMQYGYVNIIIQGVNGWMGNQGNFHGSTFRDINESKGEQYRLTRIQITDKALGIRDI